jgi:hypothetical protein
MKKLRSVAFVLGLVLCLTAGAQNNDPAPAVHTGSPQAAGAKLMDMARDRFENWLRDTQSVAMGLVH